MRRGASASPAGERAAGFFAPYRFWRLDCRNEMDLCLDLGGKRHDVAERIKRSEVVVVSFEGTRQAVERVFVPAADPNKEDQGFQYAPPPTHTHTCARETRRK